MTTIIAWVVVFGVLVAVHELGHFSVAKAFGMRVNEYSLGFGPPLFRRQWGETLYAVRSIPLGGYVRIAGMEGEATSDPREYPNRPLWQRFSVIFAGPVMNLLLAAVLYAITFGPVGVPTPTMTVAKTLPQYPAYAAGIRAGDRIASINDRPVSTWNQLSTAIGSSSRQSVAVTVVRGSSRRTFHIHPQFDPSQKQYIIGIEPHVITVHHPPGQALVNGFSQTVQLTGSWFVYFGRMITGQGAFDVAGPVGIAVMVGQAARAGIFYLLLMAAGLSANLGLFNILPVPVLDGSRLVLLVVEGVRKKALDPAKESVIFMVGMAVMLLFVVFVTFHDITHLILRH